MSNIGDKLVSEYVKTHDWKGEERRKYTPRTLEEGMATFNDDVKKTNGWNEWAKKVLADNEEAKKDIGLLYDKINLLVANISDKINKVGADSVDGSLEVKMEVLEKMNKMHNEIMKKITELEVMMTGKFAVLETKAVSSGALWGALLGVGASIIVAYISHLLTHGGKG